jgi:predicted RNA-binding protein with PUA-like domain
MNHWLIKSEPTSYSIDDLKRDKHTAWTGVRNFQARNHMRAMKKGDLLFFYHSSSELTGVYGVAKVVKEAYVDPTALDPKDDHYDPKAVEYQKEGRLSAGGPLWGCVDVAFESKLNRPVSLEEMKRDHKLNGMLVLRPGMRLSVMPVSEEHFERVLELGK